MKDLQVLLPHKQRPPTIYTPCDLPALPRARCPFECQKTETRWGCKQDVYLVTTPCTSKALANGWCVLHQPCQELLEWGAQLGYPRLQINPGLRIAGGVINWEAYAVRYPGGKRREQVRRAIEAYKATQAEQWRQIEEQIIFDEASRTWRLLEKEENYGHRNE